MGENAWFGVQKFGFVEVSGLILAFAGESASHSESSSNPGLLRRKSLRLVQNC